MRAIDTRGRTFRGGNRGGHLPDHDAWVEACLDRSDAVLDVPPLRRLWAELRDLPPRERRRDDHGDLIPGNVLVAGGRLAGVSTSAASGLADPALDLVAAWHLLDPGPREALRTDLACAEVEWARGAAWALEQAVGLVRYYPRATRPMSRLGRRTLRAAGHVPPPLIRRPSAASRRPLRPY